MRLLLAALTLAACPPTGEFAAGPSGGGAWMSPDPGQDPIDPIDPNDDPNPEGHPHGVDHPEFIYAPELMLVEDDPCFHDAIPSPDRDELILEFACYPQYEPGVGHLVAGVRDGGYLVWIDDVIWKGMRAYADTTPGVLGDAILEGSFGG